MKSFKDYSPKEVQEILAYQEKQKEEYIKNNKIKSILFIGVGYFGGEVADKILVNEKISKLCIEDLKNKKDIIQNIQKNDYVIICHDSSDKKLNKLVEKIADMCFEQKTKFIICHCCTIFGLWSTPKAEEVFLNNKNNFIEKMQKKEYLIYEVPFITTFMTYDKFQYEYKGEKYICKLQAAPFEMKISATATADLLLLMIQKIIEERK